MQRRQPSRGADFVDGADAGLHVRDVDLRRRLRIGLAVVDRNHFDLRPAEPVEENAEQPIATDDGSTRLFTLICTCRASEYSSSEPVGVIDDTAVFNAYLDGVVQSVGTEYTRVESVPCQQQIQFATAPANGKVISVDMGYYYYCKFADSKLTLEEFMHRLWTLNKFVLHSCRAGA